LPRRSTILDFRPILLFIAGIGYLFCIQDFINGRLYDSAIIFSYLKHRAYH